MRSFATATIAMVIVVAPALADAQSGIVAPTETQFKLYQEGAEAYGEGEYSKAVDLFRASLRLGELNITYLNLGRALFKLGDCEEASRAYASALTAPKIANPTPVEVLTKVEEYKKDLGQCPATLTVQCDNPAARLWVDGTGPVPCDGAAMTVLPGPHTVEARLGTQSRREDLTLAAMDTHTMELHFLRNGPVGPAGPTNPVVAASTPDTATRVRVGANVAVPATGSAEIGADTSFEGPATQDVDDETGGGVNLFGGYRLSGGLVLGLAVSYFPSYKLVYKGQDALKDATQLDTNALVIYEFLDGSLVPFVSFELGYSTIDVRDLTDPFTGYNTGLAAGARYHLTRNIAVGLDLRVAYYAVTTEVSENGLGEDDFSFSTETEYSVTGTRTLVNLGATFAF